MTPLLAYLYGLELRPTFFLCLQAMILGASAEVFYRYTRWYVSTERSEGLILRSLVLGIVVTHAAVFGDRFSWMYENFRHPNIMDHMMNALASEYTRLVYIRSALYIGVIVHLLPIWRIVYRANTWQIARMVIVRALFAIAVYFVALALNGSLTCLTHAGCQLGG